MGSFSGARALSLTAPLGVGLLLGLLGPLAGKLDSPASVVVDVIFSGGWSWACYAFLVGHLRQSKIESVILAPLGLAIGVVTYYLFKDSILAATSVGLQAGASGSGFKIGVWGVLAFVFGAPLGLLGNVARVPGIGGLFFRLLIPLVAFYETSMRLAGESRGQGLIVTNTWNAVRFIAVAVAFALVGHTIWSWWHARRARSSRSEELDCRQARDVS
ncbi:hypothetical protein K7396_03625 [Streptomyces angustmyceticus]|nr:hypothetical protein K7396_03625 [Streptomyces angustmyceticus]